VLYQIQGLTYKIEDCAVRSRLFYRIAGRYYKSVIEKETALANITSRDHILCIGGGICPFSAILFRQATGARVTVIDNNYACIPKARQVIRRLELQSDVTVLHQEGGCANLDYAAYSVIHLALQVSPMEQVFSKLKQQIHPGTRLLLRRPKKHLGGMSRAIPADSPFISHKSRNIGSTLLYTKPADA